MTIYRLFDGLVAIDLPFSGVPEVTQGEADMEIVLGQDSVSDAGYDWLHAWREADGELVLSCARQSDAGDSTRHLLRFPDLADFVITSSKITSSKITCHPQPDCREDSLRHLLLDQVIPRLWAHRGNLVLHASAVQLPGGKVIAFLGESGWGKSTMAAALQARGSRLISDDSISLQATAEGVRLIPSYTGLRLNDDSIASLNLAGQSWTSVAHYSSKRQFVSAPDDPGQPLLLDTLYVMDEPGSSAGPFSTNLLSGAELITTLIKQSFLLDTRDRQCATVQLREASAVMRAVPHVRSLAYPRDYQQLPAVCDALIAEASR